MPLKIWPGLKYVLSPKSAAFSTPSSPFVVSRKFSGLMSLRQRRKTCRGCSTTHYLHELQL